MNSVWYYGGSLALALFAFLYNVFFAPTRADKRDLEKRLAQLELHDANHENRLTGFSVQLERQGDQMEARCAKIEGQLSEVGRMREDLAVVKAKMDGQAEAVNDIKSTIKEIFNLLRVSKN